MLDQYRNNYRFNLRSWLLNLPVDKRSLAMKKMIVESNQGKHTIKRIIYMKAGDTGYVRPETKTAICKVFGKDITQLENEIKIYEQQDK